MHQLAKNSDYGEGPALIAIVGTARWPGQLREVETCFYTLSNDIPVRLMPRRVNDLPSPADRVRAWPWPAASA